MGTETANHDEDMAAVTETDPMENVVFYKSQPTALNLAHNAIPEDSVWTSSPVVCGEPSTGDMDRPADGVMMEIDLDDVQPLTPPDGGWGWLIVLGSFMCMFLVDGVCFSYGIFLSELEATFGASKMQMTLAGSLLTGCYFMVGPVVSGLMNRFGARKLVVIGSVISSAAILGSSFATDVNTFIGVFGVIGGIGYGLIYLPAATIVTSWFVRKRATVTGIITAGSGIGVTCYSIAIPHLIRKFTWRGSILLLSAINLNAAVAGVLFRPLISNQPEVTKNKSFVDVIVDPDSTDSSFPNVRGAAGNSRLPRHSSTILVQRKTSVKQLARQYVDSVAIAESNRAKGLDENPANSTSGLNDGWTKQFTRRETSRKSNTSWDDIIITHGNQLVQVPEDATLANTSADRLPMLSVEAVNHIVEGVLSRQSLLSSTNLAVPDRTAKRKPSGMMLSGSQRWLASTASQLGQVTVRPSDNAVVYLKPDNMGSTSYFASAVSLRTVGDLNTSVIDEQTVRDAIVREIRKEVARPVHRKDLFLSGSLIHIDEYITNPQVESYIRTVTSPAEETQTRNPVLAMLRNMFGLNILKSPTFQLLNISSIITMIGYIVPYQFMKDNAQTLGFAEAESAYLLAYLGILNTIGRLISGWLSDRPWANVILINNVSLVLSGIATAFVPVLRTYAALLAYACCFGFIISAFIAVRTILIVEVLGLDRLTNAYGFMLLFQGFAIIAAPPLLGSFYDVFRNFDFTFIFGGVALFVSGLLCFPLAAVARWERRKELAGTDANDPENEDDFLPSDTTGLMRIIRKLRDSCVKYCCCRQTRVGYDPTEMVQNDIDVRIDQMPGVQ